MSTDHLDASTDHLDAIRGTRIAHLIETDGPGGAERLLSDLAKALSHGGCPGVVFLPRDHEGWLTREIESAGIPVEHYRLDSSYSPQCVRDLAAALRRHRIGLAHSHEFTMGVYGTMAARTVGIPHLITMHGGRYYAGRLRRRLMMRFAVEASGGVVAVSEELAQHLCTDLRVARHRIQVITNGVPARRSHESSTLFAELGLQSDDRVLLSVGNLYPVKGHRHLIEALARLPESLRAQVVIAGRGDLAAELEALALSLGVAERVYLIGLRDDIQNLHAAADVFVHPSLAEGLPLALLEAMFSSCAIVASAVGEIPTVLGHGAAGTLVPPGDAEALADAIAAILADAPAARALGARAAARAQEFYGLDGMVQRYAQLYARLLSPTSVSRRSGALAVIEDPPALLGSVSAG